VPKVIITLPAYHAEETLARTVADIPAGVADELILVDDASRDGTVARARELSMHVYVHAENRGYGGNQKTCYLRALEHGGDIVVLLHPDYQYDPRAVPLLVAPIVAGDADMTFGSRFAGVSDPRAGGMPLYRFAGNRLTTAIENVLLGSRFTEMHSGLRAYTRGCLLRRPFLRYSDDFAFDSQFLIDAVTSGERVVEVPIATRYTKESSSISIPASLRYVGETLAHSAGAAIRRGRRGRRSPATFGGARVAPRRRGAGVPVAGQCALCGAAALGLVYPANTGDPLAIDEFACTSGALARHDDIVQCRRCGMMSSRAAADAGAILAHYEQVVDEPYLAEQHGRTELFEWVLDRMDGYVVPERRLLEIGANVGLFLTVAGRRGWDARGVEPSRWAVATGRELFGVALEHGSVDRLPAGEPADAVVMLDVLEHLPDPRAALTGLRARIAREGLLVLSTVNVEGLHGRLRGGSWPWFIRPHLHYFTPETLDGLLARTGYDLVEWRIVPRSFHLSYVAGRLRSSQGLLAAAAARAARVADPRIPVGWLGDVVLAIARPRSER
jgi:2-polyprenyl-3-methyl-5-hydroxy-6-metoxy-1,4-benzoquinol methylase